MKYLVMAMLALSGCTTIEITDNSGDITIDASKNIPVTSELLK